MTDSQFKDLMSLKKVFINVKKLRLPTDNELITYNLLSTNYKNKFYLDYDRRGSVELKHKTQLRHDKSILLVRLELNSPPHMNPDGTITGRNHIHVYREGYELKWAYELHAIFPKLLSNPNSLELFTFFCEYCNIDLHSISLQGVI